MQEITTVPSLLHHQFDAQVIKQPNAIAISSPSKKLSYLELFNLSEHIASKLIEAGAAPNQLIGIVMEKGWEQAAAALAVSKSGAAYLPIDSNETTERLHHLLKISDSSIVLTQTHLKGKLKWPSNTHVITIDEALAQQSQLIKYSIKPDIQTESDLAYVIFTSGSTGTPKGVMISHKAVLNTILDINQRFSVTENDRIFAISALNFDLSVYDIFGALSAGASIIFPSKDALKDPSSWLKLLINEEITVWNSVPSIFQMFVEYIEGRTTDSSLKKLDHKLRLVLLSGDWISTSLPQKIFSQFGNLQLISLGGATEASIWSIFYPIKSVEKSWKSIPYGRALLNQAVYVLDDDLNPIEPGIPGAIYIGGVGLAMGYWKDDQRTKSHFILNQKTRERLYRTGDLGQYMADGNIEFLGRIDQQVKIRGFRVDLNAIEHCLLNHPDIEKAVVVAAGDENNKKIIACVVEKNSIPSSGGFEYSKKQINYWQNLYNQIYLNSKQEEVLFNIAGWKDSYTSKHIPKEQMEEWVSKTVNRILALKPRQVFEIGCGSGLLLLKIAPEATSYYATDFSDAAIDCINRTLSYTNLGNVKFEKREAVDFQNISESSFDTIIINSVVQYFPSIDYLEDVLQKSIEAVADDGCIFIGDIRSLEYLKAFYTSILLSNLDKDQTLSSLSHSSAGWSKQEDELVIHHHYFYALKKKFKQISHVNILLKDGKFDNELNKFRYDVILHIKKRPQISELKTSISIENFKSIKNIEEKLNGNIESILAIRGVPNKNIAGIGDSFSSDNEKVSSLRNKTTIKRLSSISPWKLYQLAKKMNYQLSLKPASHGSNELMDAVFYKDKFEFHACSLMESFSLEFAIKKHTLFNSPTLSRHNKSLVKVLKKYLRTFLPRYMMPSTFSILNRLPITSNGKIDRQLIIGNHSISIKKYKAPENKVQRHLVELWEKLTDNSSVGINDDFFEIGGNSLLLINLLSQINKKFDITIASRDLDQASLTILNLSLIIQNHLKNKPSQIVSMA